MTLIIGIKCSDGIVMGADGAATLGRPGQPTVIQPVTKLHVAPSQLIVGFSGHVGLAQLCQSNFEQLWEESIRNQSATRSELQRKLYDAISPEAQRVLSQSAPFGNHAVSIALIHSLVAAPVDGHTELIQCDYPTMAEFATDDLPYVAIGSGQPLADPFLAFIRRIFWPDTPPRLAQGVFAAVWTLQHTIEVNPGGVADPIQIMTLTYDKTGTPSARLLTPEELVEHRQMIAEAEQHLRDIGGS